MFHKYIFITAIIIAFIGCSEPTLNIDSQSQVNIPPKQPVQVQRNKGALYSRQGASLFADKKDLQIGDILQVIVDENLTNDSKGSRSNSKNNASSLGAGVVTPATGVTLTQGGQDRVNKFNATVGVGFNSTTANTFAGANTSKVDEKFETTISVIIEQTYQNGNYLVKGTKNLLIDGQKQSMAITGVIRPYDISPENTVYSHQLANLKIQYSKEGEENDVNHKGWGTKIIENIWPF